MANPFPYAPFLVMHFGLSHDERALGFYAGFVLAAFMVGRIVSSYPLGILSDKWGRRPVIEMGLLVSCVFFQLGFALTPNFTLALGFRFLMGATNGIIGVSKAWLPELVPTDRQPMAMSMISGMWGIALWREITKHLNISFFVASTAAIICGSALLVSSTATDGAAACAAK